METPLEGLWLHPAPLAHHLPRSSLAKELPRVHPGPRCRPPGPRILPCPSPESLVPVRKASLEGSGEGSRAQTLPFGDPSAPPKPPPHPGPALRASPSTALGGGLLIPITPKPFQEGLKKIKRPWGCFVRANFTLTSPWAKPWHPSRSARPNPPSATAPPRVQLCMVFNLGGVGVFVCLFFY